MLIQLEDNEPNITISLEEKLLEAGCLDAQTHRTSLNGLIRKILGQTVQSDSRDWMDELFELMDQAKSRSGVITRRREDLYDG